MLKPKIGAIIMCSLFWFWDMRMSFGGTIGGSAVAGKIVWKSDENPPPIKTITVALTCKQGERKIVTISINSPYRLDVSGKGKCVLAVTYGEYQWSINVFIEEKPLHVDLELSEKDDAIMLYRR